MKKKFASRKFIACVAGVLAGIGVILAGNVNEGLIAIIASVVTYICAEAGIDKAAVKDALEGVADGLQDKKENTNIKGEE